MTTVNTLLSGGQGVAVPSGFVGSIKIATIAGVGSGSMPAVGTVINLGSLSLTPGLWLVYGQVGFTSGATTSSTNDPYVTASISTTSATENNSTSVAITFVQNAGGASRTANLVTYTNLTTTTTIYLVTRHGATTISTAVYGSSSAAFGSQLWAMQIQ